MPAEERAIQRHIERLFVAFCHAMQAFDCMTSNARARSSHLWATATCHVPACRARGLVWQVRECALKLGWREILDKAVRPDMLWMDANNSHTRERFTTLQATFNS